MTHNNGLFDTFFEGSNGLAGGIPKEMAKLSKLKYMGIGTEIHCDVLGWRWLAWVTNT